MKYKLSFSFYLAVFLLVSGFFKAPEEVPKAEEIETAKKKTAAFYPTFVQEGNINYIKLASKGGLCGGVTLTRKNALPAGQQLVLRAFKYKRERNGKGFGKKKIGEWSLKLGESMRFTYDWAGFRPSSHFRIYCYIKGKENSVKCSDYIDLKEIKHNVSCMFGGAQGGYSRWIGLR